MVNLDSPEQGILQVGSIKLTKNSKGFTWEIKVNENFTPEKNDAILRELKRLHDEMLNNFGGGDL